MLCFGCITIAQGFVKSYSGLIATRCFLGLGVASIFPGCFYLAAMYVFRLLNQYSTDLSSFIRWYKRSEAQKRFTFLFCFTSLSGAFGGLLAYGISKLDGMAGLASWRWVFIISLSIIPLPVVAPRPTSQPQRVS